MPNVAHRPPPTTTGSGSNRTRHRAHTRRIAREKARAKPNMPDSYEPPTLEELSSGLFNLLPQELFDEIFSLVFAVPASTARIILVEDYKPPKQLQINRATRQVFANNYFTSAASWIFPCGPLGFGTISKWWHSLDPAHKAILCEPRTSPYQRHPDRYNTKVPRLQRNAYKGDDTLAPGSEDDWFWYKWVNGMTGPNMPFEVLQFLPGFEVNGDTSPMGKSTVQAVESS